jgi:glycosyltransferase involved in cell wall biosynthesis
MTPTTVRGLASIIIPCWNQLEYTRQCIAALKQHTRLPWELIVVDNGSTDGTAVYLAGVQDAASEPVTVVANATNRGFPATINQRLQLARGEYLVLLNSGVVVTDAWLDQLVALANARTHLTDEENNLPRCLESVRGLFDEIVVVDTGSTDRTIEIARSFGAKVFEFAWIDDFAAARNEALAYATGDYAFWLDANDVVEPPQREKLTALLNGLGGVPAIKMGTGTASCESQSPFCSVRAIKIGTGTASCESQSPFCSQAAYVVRCACNPSPDGTGGESVVDHIRLLPLRPEVRWTYRVHEQILPSLNWANVPIRWTDLTVRHTGYVDKALRARKLDRDCRILQRELEERPDEPFVVFNLRSASSRPVLQLRPGDLRPPDPAQPRDAGRRAWRSCPGRAALAGGARRMPRRSRGAGEAGTTARGEARPARDAERPSYFSKLSRWGIAACGHRFPPIWTARSAQFPMPVPSTLKQLPSLEKIRLYQTAVDDVGVQHLSEIPTLRLVDRSMTQITDAAFQSLAHLPNPNRSMMKSTGVSDPAVGTTRRRATSKR